MSAPRAPRALFERKRPEPWVLAAWIVGGLLSVTFWAALVALIVWMIRCYD